MDLGKLFGDAASGVGSFIGDTGKNLANTVSSVGQAVGAPVLFDWNTDAAKQDALLGARDANGNLKRTQNSVAGTEVWNTPTATIDGKTYNPYGEVISTSPVTKTLLQLPAITDKMVVGYDMQGNPVYNGSSSSNGTFTSADEQSQYADQIANINKLLGLTETQKASGLGRISSEFDAAKLKQDKSIADQRLQNEQSKEQGINEVGNFANTSINNLRRLLQGGNAGRSSVGQILAPYMVGKAADTRRTGVLNTAGENARLLDTTQNESTQSLENQRKKSEEDFVSSILNKQNELTGQRQGLEMNKTLATGAGYGAARTAAQNSTNELATRQNELTSLFDKYKPNYTTKEVAPLSTYQVDPSTLITNNQNSPTQSSYYLSQFKKKQQGL